MKFDQNKLAKLVVVTNLVTIISALLYFMKVVNTDTVMTCLGVSQICSGWSQLVISKQSKEKKGKGVAIFSLAIGFLVIAVVIARILVTNS